MTLQGDKDVLENGHLVFSQLRFLCMFERITLYRADEEKPLKAGAVTPQSRLQESRSQARRRQWDYASKRFK